MKYEMIFGDQKRFNEQNNEMTEVMLWHDCLGPNFVSIKELSRMNLEGAIPHGSVVLAMRRIIQEPKRWTMSDKISGEGPNIGDILMLGGLTVEFIGISLIDNYEWYVRHPSGRCESANFKYFYPSETPEEKAARLRSEWVSNVGVMIDRHCEGANVASVTVRNFIYDALLSGELPVPTKGGE